MIAITEITETMNPVEAGLLLLAELLASDTTAEWFCAVCDELTRVAHRPGRTPMDTMQGLYDEDRSITITGHSGEVSIRVGNQEPILVPALQFAEVALAAIVEAAR